MSSSNLASEIPNLPAVVKLGFKEDFMEVSLSDGRVLSIPLAWYPSLAHAKKSHLENYEISPGGYGIHWPDLDEDLSVKGFLLP